MKRLNVLATDDNLYAVLDFVDKSADGLFKDMKNEIAMAVEEIYINIAHYAYESRSGEVSVTVLADDGTITIEFMDSGVAFNPLETATPSSPQSIDDAEIGGLGILMVKELMDTVQYRREEDKNIFTISKSKGSTHL